MKKLQEIPKKKKKCQEIFQEILRNIFTRQNNNNNFIPLENIDRKKQEFFLSFMVRRTDARNTRVTEYLISIAVGGVMNYKNLERVKVECGQCM